VTSCPKTRLADPAASPSEAPVKPVGRYKLAAAVEPALPIEPSLDIEDVCEIRRISRRTGERERSAGLWPKPDFFVGTGKRKSPRWRPETIRASIERGSRP
jgi:hypothetical protein